MTLEAISIGIVCYNNASSIEPCLKSIAQQNRTHLVEIIIVDNGSTDGSAKIIETFFQSHHHISWVYRRNVQNNLSTARNLIIQLAQYPLVAYIDADCEAPSNWLNSLHQQFQNIKLKDPLTSGICAGNRPTKNSDLHQAIHLLQSSFFGNGRSPQAWIPNTKPHKVSHLPTTNCLFDRQVLIEVGGFDSRFVRVCEDVDLGLRIRAKGHNLYLVSEPVVKNGNYPSIWTWTKRKFLFGYGNSQVFKKHLIYWHPPHIFSSLLILCFLLLGPIPFVAYTCTMACVAFAQTISTKQTRLFPLLFALYISTHISYGLGSVCGLLHLRKQKYEKMDTVYG